MALSGGVYGSGISDVLTTGSWWDGNYAPGVAFWGWFDDAVISFAAIFSRWGDANDGGRVDPDDVLLMSQRLFDIALGYDHFGHPINERAANVTTSGELGSEDMLRLNRWLFDLAVNSHFGAVLGRP